MTTKRPAPVFPSCLRASVPEPARRGGSLSPRHLGTSTPSLPAHWPLWLLIVLFAMLAARFAPTRAEGQGPIAAVGSCLGDVNGDRAVNAADLSTVLRNYGKDPARWVEGDINDDGRVDRADLVVVLETFGCKEF